MDDFCPPLPPSFQQPSTSSQHVAAIADDDDEDFAIGPVLPGTSSASRRHYEQPTFSKDDKDTKGREEWMLSLPDMKKKNQLSQLHGSLPTSFRKSAVPSQDDSWTKNPNEEPDSADKKDKHKRSTSDRDACFDQAYDREQEKTVKKSKKDRDRDRKSLLDIHREKLKKEKKKKKKEKKDEKPERRPFSRDSDLAWNANDSKRKTKAIASMSQPDSRFHSGSRKYL